MIFLYPYFHIDQTNTFLKLGKHARHYKFINIAGKSVNLISAVEQNAGLLTWDQSTQDVRVLPSKQGQSLLSERLFPWLSSVMCKTFHPRGWHSWLYWLSWQEQGWGETALAWQAVEDGHISPRCRDRWRMYTVAWQLPWEYFASSRLQKDKDVPNKIVSNYVIKSPQFCDWPLCNRTP